jgi:hypothetical protein
MCGQRQQLCHRIGRAALPIMGDGGVVQSIDAELCGSMNASPHCTASKAICPTPAIRNDSEKSIRASHARSLV